MSVALVQTDANPKEVSVNVQGNKGTGCLILCSVKDFYSIIRMCAVNGFQVLKFNIVIL